MQDAETGTRLGEVVEASSAAFTVQCYDLYGAPALGALVRTGKDSPVYGVVRNVVTSPMDPGRRPVARGQNEADEEAVYQSNPQLAALLRTDFQATIVGYPGSIGTGMRYGLPSHPPRIHAFVHVCAPPEVSAFTKDLRFLPLVLAGAATEADEVVAAFLRQAASAQADPHEFLITAGRQMARLLSRDLQRLNAILGSLQP